MDNEELDLVITEDTANIDNNIDMDLLVDNQDDKEQDYLDNVNKEPIEQSDIVVENDCECETESCEHESEESDPVEATENFIHKMLCMSDDDLARGAEELKMYEMKKDIGINSDSKSLESIKVVDRMFYDTTYQSFEAFEIEEAGQYARENFKNTFTSSLRPVSMQDYRANQTMFDNVVFKKALTEFREKFLNPNMASTCSYHVNEASKYGTVTMNIRFSDKNGNKSPLACVYALEWFKGKPACKPIVPVMLIDQSIEKLGGYFKTSFFMNDKKINKNLKKFKTINSIEDFFSIDGVEEMVKDKFLVDIKKKGYTLASIDECQNLKSTFFNSFFRGLNPSGYGQYVAKYVKKFGVVWAYFFNNGTIDVCGMVKNKSGKLTSVLFGILPCSTSALIDDLDKESKKKSKEEFDPISGTWF